MSSTTTEALNWTPASSKPDDQMTVLCWSDGGYFCGWWDSAEGVWRDCESGGIARDMTHWCEPQGPQS